MKILHTSDWHLGRSLYGRKRYEEFSAFLDWLASTIETERIDLLLVAGDIFDTGTPGNRAQELYYQFLCRVAGSSCRNIVITAGNHDSPSFLNAPKELLRALNVHVIGSITTDPDDEVVVLKKEPRMDTNGHELLTEKHPQIKTGEDYAIVCAVPYLRDRDVRTAEPGETIEDKNKKLVEGIRAHYAEVVTIAEEKRKNLLESAPSADTKVPIIAMGHLFTAGGKTTDGDGVRDLYVGSLAHVGTDIFPEVLDYVALGHLHVPQPVGKTDHIRYSGSPIPIGFGEAMQKKSVVLFEIKNQKSEIRLLEVPCFQSLVRIVGSRDDILGKLDALKNEESSAWVEIEYTGNEIIPDLRDILEESIAGSELEILRIRNRQTFNYAIRAVTQEETLDDLSVHDVFERCLDAFDVSDEERDDLKATYNEVVLSIHEEDKNDL